MQEEWIIMEREDFKLVGNDEITWEYEGTQHHIKKHKIVAFFLVYNRILNLLFEDADGELYDEYYDFYGKHIFSYNQIENTIYCFNNSFKIKGTLMADFDFVHERILCIVGEGMGLSGHNHLELYDKNGNLLRKVTAPFHYGFYGFFGLEDGSLDIVLLGDSSTKDKFGRNEFRFKYNFETNELTKYSLAY